MNRWKSIAVPECIFPCCSRRFSPDYDRGEVHSSIRRETERPLSSDLEMTGSFNTGRLIHSDLLIDTRGLTAFFHLHLGSATRRMALWFPTRFQGPGKYG